MHDDALTLGYMAKVGLKEAARLTGKNASTITRAAKAGRISCSQDQHGNRTFEVAELDRVFGLEPQPSGNARVRTDADAPPRTSAHEVRNAPPDPVLITAHQREVSLLEEHVRLLKNQLEDTQKDRDHWRQQATALLTDQRSKTDNGEEGARDPQPSEATDEKREEIVAAGSAPDVKGAKAEQGKGDEGTQALVKEPQRAEPKVEEGAAADEGGATEASAPAMRGDVVGVDDYPPSRRSWWQRLFGR